LFVILTDWIGDSVKITIYFSVTHKLKSKNADESAQIWKSMIINML
jgi:hypothetical protein